MPDDLRIASLHVYPVKGAAAVDVDQIDFTDDGLIVGDRGAMIVETATGRFVSQRQVATLARLHATLPTADGTLSLSMAGRGSIDVPDVNGATRSVTVWDDTFDAADAGDAAAAWLSACLDRDVRLVRLRRPTGRAVDPFWTPAHAPIATSFADLAPLLVTNTASLAELNRQRADRGLAAVPMSRFRPNVVIEGTAAFAEDAIATIAVDNGATLRLIKPCARCQVTEIDQASGTAQGDHVLEVLATFRLMPNRRGTRGVMFGQNAIVDRPAKPLRVGDRAFATAV